jgi:hypothetical protein
MLLDVEHTLTISRVDYARLASPEVNRKYPAIPSLSFPHRDHGILRGVAQNISVIQWKDLAQSFLNINASDSSEVRRVKQELMSAA